MSKVLDAQAAPSTAAEEAEDYSFADFKKEQAAAKESGTSVEFSKETSEVAPASERVESPAEGTQTAATPKQGMTDEQKSARKHANDGKRIPEFLKQISDLKAENARLQRETAEKRTPVPATAKTAVQADPNDPAPNPDDFKGDNAWLEFVDARAEWKARQTYKGIREKETADATAKTEAEQNASLKSKLDAYSEQHEDFGSILASVIDAVDTAYPAVSSAIAGHDTPAELIHYLGQNPALMERITAANGNQARALMALGQIVAQFEEISASLVSGTATKKPLPKPPVNLNGRGRSPSPSEIQDKAAEDDDFTTWRQAEKAKPKTRDKWSRA